MKATAAFKMKKTIKYQLATFTDAHRRGEFKRAMIQAQMASAIRSKDRRGKPAATTADQPEE